LHKPYNSAALQFGAACDYSSAFHAMGKEQPIEDLNTKV